MKHLSILFASALLVFTSCNDFLDVQPKGETIPTTYADYNSIISDPILCKGSETYLCYLTDDIRFSDGDVKSNFSSRNDLTKNLYSFAHGPVLNSGQDDKLWKNSYYRIYVLNAVINNIMNTTDETEEKKIQLKSQALAGRAYEYLTLVAAFSPTYDSSSADRDYGVPIILSEDINNMNYNRNSVREVYLQIEKDLLYAYDHLGETSTTTFRPTKFAAAGLLSRMYLRMGNYTNALKYANIVLASNSEVIDLKLYSGKMRNGIPNDGIGIVLASDMKTPFPDGDKNIENIYTRFQPESFTNHHDIYASQDLLKVFEDNLPTGAVDMRRQLYYRNDKWGSYIFPGLTMWGPRFYLNMAITTSETLLTAAECYARMGDRTSLNKAAEIYNKFRNNRIKGNIDTTFTDSLDALTKILSERRKEFAFVGEIRLVDLKRLNKDPRFAKTVTHIADGNTWTIEPNDLRYILPLPPKIFSFRPDLPDIER